MSLQRNIAANYAGYIYTGLVGLAVVPVYLRIMGAEAYGLVGFFAMLQAWAQLLDLGMTATMSRETARHRAGVLGARELRELLRSLEVLFWPIAALMAVAMALASPAITKTWLGVAQIQRADVEIALVLMGATIALRWVSGLYRGVIAGLERQVWLNGFNVTVVTVRFVVVLLVMQAMGTGPIVFFGFQLAISVVEAGSLVAKTYFLVPASGSAAVRGSLQALAAVLGFSARAAFATVVWVVVTQLDKLLISTVLPLAQYGHFTAAVMAASPLLMLCAAVSQGLQPQLTRLAQQASQADFISLYRRATQWTSAVTVALTLGLVAFAEPILWSWTGDKSMAAAYAPVLALYAAGNGIMTLAAFPSYLQYARGDLRLYMWSNVLLAAYMIPAIVLASLRYGAIGAGWAWLLSNAAFFLFAAPVVHHRFAPGMHLQWLWRDVIRIIALPCCVGALASMMPLASLGRIASAAIPVAVSLAMLALALWMSDQARSRLFILYRRLAGRVR